VERVGADGVAAGTTAVANGEFSGSSSSSNRHVSNNSVGYTDAGGGSGSVSSDVWNDRPTAAVRAGYAGEASDHYTNSVPALQRQPRSLHSNDVQEYVLSSVDFTCFYYFNFVFSAAFFHCECMD